MTDLKYVSAPITKATDAGFDAIVSTDRIDTDGERVLPKGLVNRDEFLANPLVYWAHEWAMTHGAAEPIGKATRLDIGAKSIESSAIFAPTPKAQNIKALVYGGFVRRTSIGAAEVDVKSIDGVPTWVSWKMREWSVVPMPANTDAHITGTKSALLWLADEVAEPLSEVPPSIVESGRPLDQETVRAIRDKDLSVSVSFTPVDIKRLVDATIADRLDLSTENGSLTVSDRGKRLLVMRKRRVLTLPS